MCTYYASVNSIASLVYTCYKWRLLRLASSRIAYQLITSTTPTVFHLLVLVQLFSS